MSPFPRILEINTWTYLNKLSKHFSRPIRIGGISEKEWEKFKRQGFDAIWLMGVWKRSSKARDIALNDSDLKAAYSHLFPKWAPEDIGGSPYAIHAYEFDPQVGSKADFKKLRKTFDKLGLALFVDFVPNHLALDHEAVQQHPEYLLEGMKDSLSSGLFFCTPGNKIFAHGRDPHFDPWKDTVQVNFFSESYRNFAKRTLRMISEYAHGVRCDMAMLGLNEVFEKTWRRFLPANSKPTKEFWEVVISDVKKHNPEFKFIAEAYWGLEKKLQTAGFDFTYDKEFYDKLLKGSVWEVRDHLQFDFEYQKRTLKFLENHDEPRAVSSFGLEKSKASAVVISTVPGAALFQEGQREGKKIKIPIQLGLEPPEPVHSQLTEFYDLLLKFASSKLFQDGNWRMYETREAWPGGKTAENILAWSWKKRNFLRLVVVNYSAEKAQARIVLPEDDLTNPLVLNDVFTSEIYHRDLEEIKSQGLYVELEGWGFHGFDVK